MVKFLKKEAPHSRRPSDPAGAFFLLMRSFVVHPLKFKRCCAAQRRMICHIPRHYKGLRRDMQVPDRV